jgi:mRNA-degrading endonuclease toxin of MazEF toxin-antitoxin module
VERFAVGRRQVLRGLKSLALYAVGDVVWGRVENPATGGYKLRPALVLASWPCNGSFDYLVCFITTSGMVDPWVRELPVDFMESGSLPKKSHLRPTYLSSIPEVTIVEKVGVVKAEWLKYAQETVRSLLP